MNMLHFRSLVSHHQASICSLPGGGAFNKFLVERISALTGCEIVIPDPIIIEYKEALIFAL